MGRSQPAVKPDGQIVPDSITLGELWVSGPIEPWLNFGLPARSESLICLVDLGLRFLPSTDDHQSPLGIVGWTLVDPSMADSARGPGIVSDADGAPIDEDSTEERLVENLSVDGIATAIVARSSCGESPESPLSILGIDHVVVMTGQLERTCEAITAATGAPLKRIRDAGRGVRQGFHRCGKVIIEVVERPDIDGETPAAIWGLVLNVEDLDSAVRWLGPDAISAPRPAVQEGRFIATVKSDAGLGVAVALMSPG